MSGEYSGYHPCPCRDCFEIAIGERQDDEDDEDDDTEDGPALCHACETAGCSADGEEECSAEHAYGQPCGDPACCPVHPAGNGYDAHAGESEYYSACPVCNE